MAEKSSQEECLTTGFRPILSGRAVPVALYLPVFLLRREYGPETVQTLLGNRPYSLCSVVLAIIGMIHCFVLENCGKMLSKIGREYSRLRINLLISDIFWSFTHEICISMGPVTPLPGS